MGMDVNLFFRYLAGRFAISWPFDILAVGRAISRIALNVNALAIGAIAPKARSKLRANPAKEPPSVFACPRMPLPAKLRLNQALWRPLDQPG
jgi:hypothetical protein